jgi:hypothetical protein
MYTLLVKLGTSERNQDCVKVKFTDFVVFLRSWSVQSLKRVHKSWTTVFRFHVRTWSFPFVSRIRPGLGPTEWAAVAKWPRSEAGSSSYVKLYLLFHCTPLCSTHEWLHISLQNGTWEYDTVGLSGNPLKHTVAYRSVAKHWLCIQWPLLGNASSIHARSNRRTVFSMRPAPRPFLCNGVINTSVQQ